MTTQQKTTVTKDAANKQFRVIREFAAPRANVWAAWTQSALLDQWWAPRPWKAVTKSMDFREGGRWLYYMSGPEGEQHWCKVEYRSITPQKKTIIATDAFCDENGKASGELPEMHWQMQFSDIEGGTRVEVVTTFKSEADMKTILEMGMEEGFLAALGNLDELLAKQ